MNDINLSINIFAVIDDIIKSIEIDSKPGPAGKERQWIENVFGFLKTKLGFYQVRVRSMPSFLSRLYAILCSYNLILKLDLPI